MPRTNALSLLLSLATLSTPFFAAAQSADPARPGTVNYIEGQASLEGRQLSAQSIGHAELTAGQYLATATGKAEILLTPGVFLRLDDNSTLKMVTPDLTHTEVALTQGRASVEVDQLYKQNDILVDLGGGQIQLLKNGLYEFDAATHTVRVFDGEAAAFHTLTPAKDEKATKVKSGKQLAFTGDAARPTGFDRDQAETSDPLLKWSSLRSDYLGEANLKLARSYATEPGFGYAGGYSGFAPGWAWSPSLYSYTWLPGDGLFFSPFGYGFYSPLYIYGGGAIYGGGIGYRGGYGRAIGYRSAIVNQSTSGSVHGASVTSSFHGASAGGGGGFHGGGGHR